MDNITNIANLIKGLGHLSAQERTLVLKRLRTEKVSDFSTLSKEELTLGRVACPEPTASFWQEQMWYLEQLSPGLPTYNVPFRFNLHGPLSIKVLTKALNEIERRHESLRTTLKFDQGKTVQVIAPVRPFELSVTDLSEEKDPKHAAIEFSKKFMQSYLDLAEGPLYDIHLLQLDKEQCEHVLLWVGSHAIADGWSVGIIIRELISLYGTFFRGEESDLDDLPIQFGDFAIWQRAKLTGKSYDLLLNYWRGQLKGCDPLRVETDFPRPSMQSMRGDTCCFSISQQTKERIAKISKSCGVTPFTILLAVYQLLLVSRTGQDECVLGTGITGRTKSELEALIGSFVNILVIRTDMSGNPTFIDLVKRVRQVTLDAMAHQDIPFGKLIQEIAPERDRSRPPLCQTMFLYGSTPLLDQEMELTPELSLNWDGISTSTVKFDFELAIDEQPDGLFGRFDYCIDLFEKETAETFCSDYVQIVETIARQPELQLSVLCPTLYKKTTGRDNTTSSKSANKYQETLNRGEAANAEMTATESLIAKAWSIALNEEQIERTDEFFAKGGHSVMATQMVAQFRKQFGVDMTLQHFLENTTVCSLAHAIEQLKKEASGKEDMISLLNHIEQLSESDVANLLKEQGEIGLTG